MISSYKQKTKQAVKVVRIIQVSVFILLVVNSSIEFILSTSANEKKKTPILLETDPISTTTNEKKKTSILLETDPISTTTNEKKKTSIILGTDPILVKQIEEFFAYHLDSAKNETALCKLFDKYLSDKSTDHNYSQLYSFLMENEKQNIKRVFEVGIGTNNVEVPYNMGKNGTPGASLYAWRDFFPNSIIYAADIDHKILFSDDRIHTYYVDQFNTKTIDELWKKIGKNKFDLIVDDGFHSFEANTNFLVNSYKHLKKGGWYIIEDIFVDSDNIAQFYHFLQNQGYQGVIVKIPYIAARAHDNDNCVLIIKKT